jgi:hypothetical protein
LSVMCVVCCQVEVSATSWSLVQRSPTECGASLCGIKKPRERGSHSPRWAVEPEKIIIINNNTYPITMMSNLKTFSRYEVDSAKCNARYCIYKFLKFGRSIGILKDFKFFQHNLYANWKIVDFV